MSTDDKKTILLVEDEAIIAMAEKMELEKYGYSVHHVTTGEKAVSTITEENFPIDLILMDIDLGSGIDGTQAAEQILNHKDIPVLFLSSHTEPEVAKKTEKITSYGYVVKNSGIVVLDASIKMALKLFNEKIERKQAEVKLQESETRFRRLAETTSVAILIYQNDYWIYANPAAEMITGYRFDELKQMKFWTIVSPEFVNLVKERGQARQRGESVSSGYEFKIITKQGEEKWVFLTGDTIELNGGKAGLISAIDITERKQAEEEITKQLAEKETLLREVHHRIKNNMATVESLLSLQADSIDNPEAIAALQDSIARVQSIRILYEKLLLGKEYHNISIKSYVEGLLDAISSVYITGNEITIQKQITDFTIDSKKAISLGIIINELLTNVFKYAFKGCENGNVSSSIERTENKIILIIQDNGIGIDERINLNKSPGMGHTLVKMLVEQLGGTFSIVSENGTKSTVQFEI